ncbi:BTAD domain-containing putative transcriptional regulator [Streptomyces sp. NPDC059176]|uniref:AfsR/SARP family transcriptional regulator n=1 Tax=unclassified Streptomyces TaxID=2593676 RepID=UPI0036B98D99
MRFNLIGPFEIVTDDGRAHRVSTPKVCQTLALLLTRPNEVVTSDALIQELWGDNPPRSAQTTLQTYVYHARRMLVSECAVNVDRQVLVTRSPGYLAQVGADEVDVMILERLVAKAQSELDEGAAASALAGLREALALWRGPVLSNVRAGEVLAGRIAHIEEIHIRALELRVQAELRLGRHREVIPELRMLVHDYPLNEWFHGQLMHALSRAGRRSEALQVYQNLRRLLDDELGLEPSPEVRLIHREVLDPAPLEPADAPGAVGRSGASVASLWNVPLAG